MDKNVDNINVRAIKKRRLSLGLRLVIPILSFVGAGVLWFYFVFEIVCDHRVYWSLAALGAGAVAIAVLLTVFAVLGKKHSWANTVTIVIGSITVVGYGIGIFSIVGGVIGNKCIHGRYDNVTVVSNESTAQTGDDSTVVDDIVSASGVAADNTQEKNNNDTQIMPVYVESKISPKAKKGIMITLIVLYAILLIAGILLVAVPSISEVISDIGICERISARAYAVIIGCMWLSVIPTVGYYFATVTPFNPSKKAKIILLVVTAVLCVIATVVFFVVLYSQDLDVFLEDSDIWFVPLSAVFAQVGIAVCYVLTFFKINVAKLNAVKPEQAGNGLMQVILHVLALMLYGIKKMIFGILTFKEKCEDVFILLAVLLLTWLGFFTAFVFAIICIALLIMLVVTYFAGVCSLAYGTNSEYKAYRFTNSMGCEQTVYSQNAHEFYDESGVYVGKSDDGGKHIYPDNK